MKIISIQVFFEGICISQSTEARAKVYIEDLMGVHRRQTFLLNKYLKSYKT